MRIKQIDNGTGAVIFHMDDDEQVRIPVYGVFFHRSIDDAVANASAVGLVVYADGTVLTDDQHYRLHSSHEGGTIVGTDGFNTCQDPACPSPRYYSMVGRTILDRLLS